jgi:hypothetical protein
MARARPDFAGALRAVFLAAFRAVILRAAIWLSFMVRFESSADDRHYSHTMDVASMLVTLFVTVNICPIARRLHLTLRDH